MKYFLVLVAMMMAVGCSDDVTTSFEGAADASGNNDVGNMSGIDTYSADAASKVDTAEADIAPDVAQEEVALPPQCTQDVDCDDKDCSTVDWCIAGVCKYKDVGGCGGGGDCDADIDCDDGNICTNDSCDETGMCKYSNFDPNFGDVRSCELDGNYCTVEFCQAGGVCKYLYTQEAKGCISCNTDADCAKLNAGTWCSEDGKYEVAGNWDKCVKNLCVDDYKSTFCPLGCNSISGVCKQGAGIDCAVAADCDDGDACTDDGCYKGGCSHSPKAQLVFASFGSIEPTVSSTNEVVVAKFTSTAIGADISLGLLNFELNGSVKLGSLITVKLYKEDVLVGTAYLQPTTNNCQVNFPGQVVYEGMSPVWTLRADFSPDVTGSTAVFNLLGEGSTDMTTACAIIAPVGLPLQGSPVKFQ